MTQEPATSPAGRNTKWVWLAVIAILALVFVTVLFWQRPRTMGSLPEEISVAQAAAMRDKGSLLLDVREPEEWTESHVPGSTHIPLGELDASVGKLPRDQEIVVVCRSGNRSKRGRDILLEAGFGRVTSMAGGLTAWAAAGQPTVAGP